jgi:hypothetical protein
VSCWGNPFPQAPTVIRGAEGAQRLSVYSHACAVMPGGSVLCWGSGESGQLGNGAPSAPGADVATPTRVPGLPLPATDVFALVMSTCAVLQNGELWCWGQMNEVSTSLEPWWTPRRVEIPV